MGQFTNVWWGDTCASTRVLGRVGLVWFGVGGWEAALLFWLGGDLC